MALTGRSSPSPAIIWPVTFCTNSGAAAGTGGRISNGAGNLRRDLHFVEMVERRVHRREVLLHDAFAALAVGLLDGVLDGRDGFVARQHAADGEEAGLHDGVDALAHAGLLGHFVAVDDVELQLLLDDLLLHRAGRWSQTSSGP